MPPRCLLQQHRVGFQTSATECLVEGGLLRADMGYMDTSYPPVKQGTILAGIPPNFEIFHGMANSNVRKISLFEDGKP